MRKILIEDVKAGASKVGFASAQVSGHAVAEVRLRTDEGNVSYYGLVELEGMPMFYSSAESRYEKEMALCYHDDAFPEAEAYFGYKKFYSEMEALAEADEAHALLLKYLVCLVRLDPWKMYTLKRLSIGSELGSFIIPVCDAEQDYLAGANGEET